MNISRILVPVLVMLSAAAILILAVQHKLSSAWFGLGVHPEVIRLLERSMEDQKELAELAGEEDGLRRQRFDEIRSAVNHLRIVEHSKERILFRYEIALFFVLAIVVVAGTSAAVVGARRDVGRMVLLQQALEALSTGGADLRRLGRWTRSFGIFARLPEPRSEVQEVAPLIERFAEVFGAAWTEIDIETRCAGPALAAIDGDLLHHLLTNLADNAARAMDGRGTLRIYLQSDAGWIVVCVTDTGPGIPMPIQDHLFQPYFSGRRIGEGTGLGLAIARKIALDHGGDLQLAETSAKGTTFRLQIPVASDDGGQP